MVCPWGHLGLRSTNYRQLLVRVRVGVPGSCPTEISVVNLDDARTALQVTGDHVQLEWRMLHRLGLSRHGLPYFGNPDLEFQVVIPLMFLCDPSQAPCLASCIVRVSVVEIIYLQHHRARKPTTTSAASIAESRRLHALPRGPRCHDERPSGPPLWTSCASPPPTRLSHRDV